MEELKKWFVDTGIWKLIKSKRFWVAVLGLAAVLGLELGPEDAEALLTVVALLIGGFALQDTASALKK